MHERVKHLDVKTALQYSAQRRRKRQISLISEAISSSNSQILPISEPVTSDPEILPQENNFLQEVKATYESLNDAYEAQGVDPKDIDPLDFAHKFNAQIGGKLPDDFRFFSAFDGMRQPRLHFLRAKVIRYANAVVRQYGYSYTVGDLRTTNDRGFYGIRNLGDKGVVFLRTQLAKENPQQ